MSAVDQLAIEIEAKVISRIEKKINKMAEKALEGTRIVCPDMKISIPMAMSLFGESRGSVNRILIEEAIPCEYTPGSGAVGDSRKFIYKDFRDARNRRLYQSQITKK